MTPGPVPPISESGLFRLLQNQPTRNAALADLSARIKARAITVEGLYRLGHTYVAALLRAPTMFEHGKLLDPGNLYEAASILSRAAIASFLFKYDAVGTTADGGTYTEPREAMVHHFNLPFFFGLSMSLNRPNWDALVEKIYRRNPGLGVFLRIINQEHAAVEKALIQKNPLPPKAGPFSLSPHDVTPITSSITRR